jgi:nucleotide-binding universal stress UspA family protein
VLFGRVIVGACGSPGSLRALRYARQIAESSDALLIPVHAWLPPGGDMADRRAPNPLLRKVWAEAAQQRLTEAIEAAWGGGPDPGGVAMRPTVVRGPAGEVLVQLADQLDDVIVIGAGRRGVLARIGHAGTSRFCLARAKCPVIAVPPSALARYAGRWPLALAFRHHGFNADEALDGVDQQ